MPAIIPENRGAPEPIAIPKHKGRATRNTTTEAGISPPKVFNKLFILIIHLIGWADRDAAGNHQVSKISVHSLNSINNKNYMEILTDNIRWRRRYGTVMIRWYPFRKMIIIVSTIDQGYMKSMMFYMQVLMLFFV
jgi:hypothetical protein